MTLLIILSLGMARQVWYINLQMAVKLTYNPAIHQRNVSSGQLPSSSSSSLPLFFSCHNNTSPYSLLPLLPFPTSSLLALVMKLLPETSCGSRTLPS